MSLSAAQQTTPAEANLWTSLTAVEVDDSLFQDILDMVAIPLDLLANIGKTPSAVFLPKLSKETGSIGFIRILPPGARVLPRFLKTVKKLGLEEVYVPAPRLDDLVQITQEKTQSVLADQKVPTKAKAKLLHDNAKLLATMTLKEKKLDKGVENASAYVDTVVGFVHKVPEAMGDLAQMLALDYNLYSHSINVCLFALCFAQFIKLPGPEAKALGMGGLFHDVGKTQISSSVLHKPGPLSTDEWEMMRKHSSLGFDLLVKYPSFPQQSLITVLHHHENMDGSGYPAGLKESELPITSRISKILDCYDAITSRRSYKQGVTGYEAIQIMYNDMLPQLSRDLLTQFVRFLGQLGKKAGRKGSPAKGSSVLALEQEGKEA
jgi:HD-GYP domain-containing protein (c-di-GMP phosphodiesterase class II)